LALGGIEYLIHWEGLPDEENSWEPKESFKSKQMIKEYEKKCRKENRVKKKEMREKRKAWTSSLTTKISRIAYAAKAFKEATSANDVKVPKVGKVDTDLANIDKVVIDAKNVKTDNVANTPDTSDDAKATSGTKVTNDDKVATTVPQVANDTKNADVPKVSGVYVTSDSSTLDYLAKISAPSTPVATCAPRPPVLGNKKKPKHLRRSDLTTAFLDSPDQIGFLMMMMENNPNFRVPPWHTS